MKILSRTIKRIIFCRNAATLCRLLLHLLFLYVITFAIIMPLACNDLRNSLYYNQTFTISPKGVQEKIIKANEQSLNAARKFLHSWTTNSTPIPEEASPAKESKIRIELVIASQSRNKVGSHLDRYEPNYLTQVVAKWVDLLQQDMEVESQYYYHATMCNVDSDPASYKELQELTKHLPAFSRFSAKDSFNLATATRKERIIKERRDFIFCIETALKSKPKYILFLEDDSLPTSDFFHVLRQLMNTHLEKNYHMGESRAIQNVSWIKLYHPDYYSSFIAYEIERVPEWISLSVILASMLTYINNKLNIFRGQIHLLWLMFLAYSLLLTQAIGRPNIMNFRRYFSPYLYSFYPSPGCCMPGMLFTNHGAQGAIDYMKYTLTKFKGLAKDQVLDMYVKHSPTKVIRFMVQPNLLTHIGMVSGVRAGVDPSRVDY